MSYRERLYSNYGKLFQDADVTFNVTKSRQWGKAYHWYFRRWLPDHTDAKIVDVGCGGGKILHFLAEKGFRDVVGIDISQDQIQIAKQINERATQADALNWLENQKSQFDLIISLDLIEHFGKEEVLIFLRCCVEALKPGGRLVIQTPNADSPFGLQHRYNDLTHEIAFNPNLLGRLMHQAGLENLEAREQGPVPLGYSVLSTVRYLIWQFFRNGIVLLNLAETGTSGKVLSRVFVISGVKSAAV
jgi:SAM-dependent methyltransferase